MELELLPSELEQVTTTGKNLLPSTLTTQTLNQVQIIKNNDGSVTLNGTTNASTDFKWFEGSLTLPAGTYYIGLITTSNDFNLYTMGTNGTNTIQNPVANAYTTLTLESETTFTRISSYTASNKTFNNVTFYPMICTALPFDYEPYTGNQPSPSPDYPQEIHIVTGDNEVYIYKKNIFNKNGDFNYGSNNHKTSLNAQGQIVSTSNYSGSRSSGQLMTVKKNTNYAVSGTLISASGNSNSNAIIEILNKSNNVLKTFYINKNQTKPYNFSFTFNTGENNKVWISFNGADSDVYTLTETIFDNIMINEGTTVLNYEPYQSQTYPITLGNLEYCKIGNYSDEFVKQEDKWYLKKNVGKHTITDTDITLISSYWYDSTGVYGASILKSVLGLPANNTDRQSLCNVSNKINAIANIAKNTYMFNGNANHVFFFSNEFDTIEHANAKLVDNVVYYNVDTPEYILLNDTLQTELNNIQKAVSYNEQTNIIQVNDDLPFIINYSANKNVPTKVSELTNDSGYVKDTDYATAQKAGPIKAGNGLNVNTSGVPSASNWNYSQYQGVTDVSFIGKGTLENVITGKELLSSSDVKNNVVSTDEDKPLSANMGKELNDRIQNLASIGKYLAMWDCTTGLPTTNPITMPYTYTTGDYYVISNVDSTNYMPNGSSYSGTASSTQYSGTETLNVGDFFYYDGTVWTMLKNTGKTVYFANIAGNPTDNSNLASALNGKVGFNDYAQTNTGGTIKADNDYGFGVNANGKLYAPEKTYAQYQNAGVSVNIGKGTLENVLGARFVTLTQAEYDALVSGGTVDSNTYYFIEEE